MIGGVNCLNNSLGNYLMIAILLSEFIIGVIDLKVRQRTTRWDLASLTMNTRIINNDVILGNDIIIYVNTIHFIGRQIPPCIAARWAC